MIHSKSLSKHISINLIDKNLIIENETKIENVHEKNNVTMCCVKKI